MHSHTLLCEAIERRRLLRFRYTDNKERIVEPHLVGENTAHHYCLLAWVVGGEGLDSEHPPGWRTYLLSDIHSAEILAHGFERARPNYSPKDNHMLHIYCCLPRLELI